MLLARSRAHTLAGQDRWKTYGCVKYTGGTAPVYISLDHTNLNSRQTCWDALEQIITRALPAAVPRNRPDRVAECEGEPNGYYDAPGQRYRLTGCTYYKPCEPNTTIGI